MEAQPSSPDIKELATTGVPSFGTVLRSNYVHYTFPFIPESKKLITIKVWPTDTKSDPDLYVSNKLPRATKQNFQWHSTEVGAVCLQIHPSDPDYSSGLHYCIGIYGSKPESNSFGISVVLSDPPIIHSLEPENNYQAKLELPPGSSAYFQYFVKGIPTGGIRYLFASPGKEKITLSFSKELYYPDPEFCQWSSKNLTSAGGLARETEPELDPFILNAKNELEYCSAIDKPYTEDHVRKEQVDSIGLKLDRFFWKLSNRMCYVGIKNDTEGSLQIFVRLGECKEKELIPAGLGTQLEVFTDLFEHIPEGSTLSKAECLMKKLLDPALTYGEIELVHFLSLLNVGADKVPRKVFWDLGCGTGKALIAAAMSPLGFSKICGVELLDTLTQAANSVISSYCSGLAKAGLDPAKERQKFNVVTGDIRTVDWLDADLIYAASLCFPEKLMREIAERGKMLKAGTRIVSLKSWPGEYYRLVHCCRVRMTWGKTKVHILERI